MLNLQAQVIDFLVFFTFRCGYGGAARFRQQRTPLASLPPTSCTRSGPQLRLILWPFRTRRTWVVSFALPVVCERPLSSTRMSTARFRLQPRLPALCMPDCRCILIRGFTLIVLHLQAKTLCKTLSLIILGSFDLVWPPGRPVAPSLWSHAR